MSVCHLSSPAHLPDEDVGVVVLTPDGVGQLQPYNGRGYREEGAVAGHSTSRLYNTQTPPQRILTNHRIYRMSFLVRGPREENTDKA